MDIENDGRVGIEIDGRMDMEYHGGINIENAVRKIMVQLPFAKE